MSAEGNNSLRELARVASIKSTGAAYTDDHITASYQYETVHVVCDKTSSPPTFTAAPNTRSLQFQTERRVPRVGVMLVGLGGNNGSTFVAGLIANKRQIQWRTKNGIKKPNWYGSLMLASTTKLGIHQETGSPIYVPLNSMVPMINPNELLVSGWDISSMSLGDAMRRSAVLEISLQDQLYEEMQKIKPLPGLVIPEYIATNQETRSDNVMTGNLQQQFDQIRSDLRQFRSSHSLDKIIVLWTATTEKFSKVLPGIHDTAENLLAAISQGSSEVSPSTVYAVASILENCSYINGSPQNTCVPAVVELASKQDVFVCGDDFKSGQTKLKSTLVDFLVSAGLKPTSIVSYNHLGNNDGLNLSSQDQFRSKEITKSTVIDDMIQNNPILYQKGESPDHCVVIKYIPYVGDSKRALDEYTSEIFMNGINTIVIHNTCEDSLLAVPIMLDLIILMELLQRIKIYNKENSLWENFHPVLSLLGYLCKAPMHPPHSPIVNSLFAQRHAIINVLRACIGLPAENFMDLEFRLPSLMMNRNNTEGVMLN